MKTRVIHLLFGGFLLIVILLILFYQVSLLLPNRDLYTNEDFGIKTYISKVDKDQDGIDNQTDILENVRAYIETKPKYRSKYYKDGYPDDSYGVCTDVVLNGLRGAGYDLRELVDSDTRLNKSLYNIERIDKNIDFRRVRNLLIYFQRHTISLTTDPKDISEWQGGDIVVFENHIGIISDKRNQKGIPLVIHHASPYQLRYEEDILERREIVGHFRVS